MRAARDRERENAGNIEGTRAFSLKRAEGNGRPTRKRRGEARRGESGFGGGAGAGDGGNREERAFQISKGVQ